MIVDTQPYSQKFGQKAKSICTEPPYEVSGGVKIIDWHTERVPSTYKESVSKIDLKLDKKYHKELDKLKKNSISLHKKVFDRAQGKFVKACDSKPGYAPEFPLKPMI